MIECSWDYDDDDDDDDDFNIKLWAKVGQIGSSPTHRLTYVQKLGARERRGTLILEEQQKALAAGDNKMQNTIVIYLS